MYIVHKYHFFPLRWCVTIEMSTVWPKIEAKGAIMFFSVDRIEQTHAVLIDEHGTPLQVPCRVLPEEAKDGDMLFYQNNTFSLDPQRTAQRRKTMAEVLRHMLKHGEEQREISAQEPHCPQGEPK